MVTAIALFGSCIILGLTIGQFLLGREDRLTERAREKKREASARVAREANLRLRADCQNRRWNLDPVQYMRDIEQGRLR